MKVNISQPDHDFLRAKHGFLAAFVAFSPCCVGLAVVIFRAAVGAESWIFKLENLSFNRVE